MTRKIWSTYSRPELLKIIRESNLKGYDKMKVSELLDLMEKHSGRFSHIKAKEGKKKGAHKPKKAGAPPKGPYKPTGRPRGRPKKSPATPKTPAMRSIYSRNRGARPTIVTPPQAQQEWAATTPLLVHKWTPQTPSLTYGVKLAMTLQNLKARSKL